MLLQRVVALFFFLRFLVGKFIKGDWRLDIGNVMTRSLFLSFHVCIDLNSSASMILTAFQNTYFI
jgi:hypothetical protein